MQKNSALKHAPQSCTDSRLAMQDTLEVVSGKWKLVILMILQTKPYRFKELTREIGISPRMLSKELQELEANKLISRTVLDTRPISVEYAITKYGLTFREVMEAMRNWGMKHRNKIIHGK